MFKLAIVGSRDYNNYNVISNYIENNFDLNDIECIISGGARGVDSIAEAFADKHNIKKMIFPADWNRFGKSAGYRRNVDIVKNSDKVLAFWNGISKGTQHSFKLAEEYGKELIIVRV